MSAAMITGWNSADCERRLHWSLLHTPCGDCGAHGLPSSLRGRSSGAEPTPGSRHGLCCHPCGCDHWTLSCHSYLCQPCQPSSCQPLWAGSEPGAPCPTSGVGLGGSRRASGLPCPPAPLGRAPSWLRHPATLPSPAALVAARPWSTFLCPAASSRGRPRPSYLWTAYGLCSADGGAKCASASPVGIGAGPWRVFSCPMTSRREPCAGPRPVASSQRPAPPPLLLRASLPCRVWPRLLVELELPGLDSLARFRFESRSAAVAALGARNGEHGDEE